MDENLIKYLENVLDLETQLYAQQNIADELEAQASQLGYYDSYAEPEKGGNSFGYYLFLWTGIGAVIGFFAALPACLSCGETGTVNGIFFGIAALGLLIGIIVGIFKRSQANNEYQAALDSYHAALDNDEKRVQSEIKMKKKLLSERSLILLQKKKTQQTLDKYYSVNVIYLNYRNLWAIASFLDYFRSGRCTSLPEAYNKYDLESKLGVIITGLNEILIRLDAIQQNQQTLYYAIQEGNRLTDSLVSQTARLAAAQEATAKNSAIAAYNSERSANELTQIKWLAIYKSTL